MLKKILCIIIIICILVTAAVFFLGKNKAEKENTADTEKNEVTEEVQKIPGKFEGKVICIDPGHGKTSRKEKEPIYPGAQEKKAANVSGASGKHMTEEELNLEVGLKLKQELEELDAEVYITRTEHESDMSNIERAEFANGKKSDIVIRLHADGSESSSVAGVSMLLPSPKRVCEGYLTGDIVKKSRMAGEYILEEVCRNTGAINRGTVERADMTGFNWSSVPVVLLEMGFMSNPEEEKKLSQDEYQRKIIAGIVSGLEIYFNKCE